jgi:hypothetical protein
MKKHSDKIKLRGRVCLYEGPTWRRGKLLWERDNLVVNTGLTALASLLGGVTAGQYVTAMGFGSGNTSPAVTDATLSQDPRYYNAIVSAVIGPSGGVAAGSVQFTYQLESTDYAANPITIQELGLFGNTGAASLPAMTGSVLGSWAGGQPYVIGNMIVDSNGNIQRCTTAGTSGGSQPTWATSIGSTTDDYNGGGTAVWTMVAAKIAPTPLIAHTVVPAFPFVGSAGYSGTWSISM